MCWRVLSALKVKVESEGKVWSLSGHDRETWSKTESTGPPATGADATPSLHSHKQWGRGGQQKQRAPAALEVKHSSSLDFFSIGHWSWHSPLPRVNDLASKPCVPWLIYTLCAMYFVNMKLWKRRMISRWKIQPPYWLFVSTWPLLLQFSANCSPPFYREK